LACLKLGAAYVPLDPAHPTQRLKQIIEFVGTRFVLVGSSQVERLAGNGFALSIVDESLMLNLPKVSRLDGRRARHDSTAMVLFTSGSTGMPKGVELTHTSFCTLAKLVGEPMDFTKTQDLRVLQFAAYAFDVANAETFLTLIYGGTLCIIRDEEKQSDLAGAVNRLRINWLYLTPSTTKLVEPHQVPLLRTLILGGEAGSRDIVTKWAPHVHLVNSFGPCEGGIWPSYAHLGPDDSPLDIGWSAECGLWIVHPDNHDQLMGPIGAVGELILQGPMLARGYLYEPEKTRAAFIPAPKWAIELGAPGPFYKTGDLVRYRGDHYGSLRYVSRQGGQVKLRGQRLDLGEVEHHIKTLLQHKMEVAPEIVTFADRNQPQLATFFCSPDLFVDGNEDLPSAQRRMHELLGDLKSRLQVILPSYMVPSVFIPLAKMPLTVSGKRDRKELRALAARTRMQAILVPDVTTGREDVSTPMEEALRELWAKILELNKEEIGAADDFMSLGGNSIDAMKLSSACKAAGL